MALHILPTLKGAALKQLAFKCGISTSGVKAAICQRLLDEIPLSENTMAYTPSRKPQRSHMRILSIDMGIRNLAYCVLDVPASSALPAIEGWKRIAVSSAPVLNSECDLKGKAEKESFEPLTLSAAAYNLLHKTLLPYKPTHILIERQRFRSMGSPRILEWTVRVNMLESMLYAILRTLQQEGLWKGIVVPIAPGKVGPFWLEEEGKPLVEEIGKAENKPETKKKVRNAKLAKALNKGAKIDLVRNWLASSDKFELASEDVVALAEAYLEKWDRKPGGPKGKRASKDAAVIVEKMGKLDDLADCLLQGMAFIQWEENKGIARHTGIEALISLNAR
jgi:cruciform cutting endonuclease 1